MADADSEPKRWSIMAMASPIRTHLFNPDTSGLVSIEKITTLQHYGGIAWDNPSGVSVPVFMHHYTKNIGRR